MTSLDEMLARLEAEHQQKQESSHPVSSLTSENIGESASNIEYLLTEITTQFDENQQGQGRQVIMTDNKSKTDIEQSLAELSGKFASKPSPSPQTKATNQVTTPKPSTSTKVEDLLEDITHGFGQQSQQQASPSPKSSTIDETMANLTTSKPIPSAKVEAVLEDITTGFIQQRQQQVSPSPKSSAIDEAMANLTTSKPIPSAKVETVLEDITTGFIQQRQQQSSTRLDESELTRLQQEYQQKKQQTKSHEQQLQEIKQRELEEQRRIKNLEREAEKWLKKLDPYSDEGLWFEQFAYSYESKLAAAMDYLQALK